MKPITVHIPDGCLLSPAAEAAVVGGNVLTSQRVTDVVLSAFTAAAPSQVCICTPSTCYPREPSAPHTSLAPQGCMNNLTFGDADMGYYETIAGGAGACPCVLLASQHVLALKALPRMQARGLAGTGAPACTRT